MKIFVWLFIVARVYKGEKFTIIGHCTKMQKPVIVNIISVANLGTQIKIASLNFTGCEFKYNPKKFNAAIIKCKHPAKSTALLWESGKMVCLGTKSLVDCEEAIKNFIEIVRQSGCSQASYQGHSVENIVSTFKFGNEIDLNEFRKIRFRSSFYEPEIFCGLKYKRGKSLTALIFWTGKVVITGSRNNSEIEEMYHHIIPYLKMSQKRLK